MKQILLSIAMLASSTGFAVDLKCEITDTSTEKVVDTLVSLNGVRKNDMYDRDRALSIGLLDQSDGNFTAGYMAAIYDLSPKNDGKVSRLLYASSGHEKGKMFSINDGEKNRRITCIAE